MKIFKIQTEHVVTFKSLIEVLKEILVDTNIEIISQNPYKKNKSSIMESDVESDVDPNLNDKSGMRIMAVDQSRTVLINLKLKAKNFTKFKCRKKKFVICVNLSNLYKLIKNVKGSENLILSVDSENINNLIININNPDERKYKNVMLKLLEPEENSLSIPDIEFDAVIIMNSVIFNKTCRELSNISDKVEIKCTANKLIFSCIGHMSSDETIFDASEDNKEITIIMDEDKKKNLIVQGIYELKNLILFSKCQQQLSENIEIFIKNNHPLTIRYTVATLGEFVLCVTPQTSNSYENNFSDEDEIYST